MDNTIVVACISFLGTCFGAIGGIITSNKLTKYRVEKLEQKVDKHNSLVERTYKIEERIRNIENEMNELKKT